MKRFLTVGEAATRAEGADKVTGKINYAADRLFPGMIWGKAVRSEFPHAKILNIDISRAKAHPGVLTVLTAEDLPDVLTGRQLRDTPILAQDHVRFVGEKIAVVGAETRELAAEAAKLIDVEYEELPAVFDPLDAMQDRAPCSIQIWPLTQTFRSPASGYQTSIRTFNGNLAIAKKVL